MSARPENVDASIVASLARHHGTSPVAFAVTDGPGHMLRYANAAFRRLQMAGDIAIGPSGAGEERVAGDLRPLLDRVFREGEAVRDQPLAPHPGGDARWSCTAWPISAGAPQIEGVVVEVRDATRADGDQTRQRAITERLLLGALREQDAARAAVEATQRANFLALASRDLATSLDENVTREMIRRRTLPRAGTWCIVDIIESTGAIHRLAVVHPDPAKQVLAHRLAERWRPAPDDRIGAPVITAAGREPKVITDDSGAALVAAAHGAENLAILRAIGFGALLVVPVVIRSTVLGAITFVTREGDVPFTAEEITLASDLAERCAMALDNARLFREADSLRIAADAASQAKSVFLGNMSHELMTPLNAIGGYTDLIEMGLRGPVSPEQHADLARIKRNQQHLIGLISEILDFVRAESGRVEYRFTTVSVRAVVHDVVEMLAGAARERELMLEQPPNTVDAVAWADPDRVRQILVNLVMNAIKYSVGNGGSITLTFAVEADVVRVHVTDTGPGIPPDKLDTIFEPFVQLRSDLTSRQGGVGLGLAISRDLARTMHGDVTVESVVGVGSRFTLMLPRASAATIFP